VGYNLLCPPRFGYRVPGLTGVALRGCVVVVGELEKLYCRRSVGVSLFRGVLP